MLSNRFRARTRRATAVSLTGALVASGAVLLTAGAAHAAVLGNVTMSRTSGTDADLFGGSVTASCPAGTNNTAWFLVGGALDPTAGDGFLTPDSTAGNQTTGTGLLSFSGASIANLNSTSTHSITTGSYQVVLQCNTNATTTDTYAVNFDYTSGSGGSWSTSPAAASVPGAPGTPTASAPVAGGSASLTWAAPGSDGGATISSYTVNAYVGASLAKSVTGVVGTSTSVTGLTNGTTYTFKVAAVNSVGTGAESAASNAVTPRAATKVVITSASSLATYGVAYPVVGKLTLANGTTAVSGQSVALQVRKKGTTTFVTVANATSVSTGAVSFSTYKPAYPIDQVRLVKATAGAFLGSTSAAKAVLTQRRITTRWSASSITLGHTTTLSGYVYPRSSALRITLQRKSGTSWVTVTYKTLPSTTASYSTYAFAVKPTTKGTFYYRVVISAASNYATSVGTAPALKVS